MPSLADLLWAGLLRLDIDKKGGRQDYLTSESKVGDAVFRYFICLV